MTGLTPEEIHVSALAAQAMNEFAALPQMHPRDVFEMEGAVHAIQLIVMARAAQRAHPDEFPVKR